jgi:hypothetical protein
VLVDPSLVDVASGELTADSPRRRGGGGIGEEQVGSREGRDPLIGLGRDGGQLRDGWREVAQVASTARRPAARRTPPAPRRDLAKRSTNLPEPPTSTGRPTFTGAVVPGQHAYENRSIPRPLGRGIWLDSRRD